MSYKTILVHLNDSRRAESVLEPAAQLATRYNSHLIGLHVYASVPASPIPMASAAARFYCRRWAQEQRSDRGNLQAHDHQQGVCGGGHGDG